MRLPWLIAVLTALYFAFSVWALESHNCFSLVQYLGPDPPERVFWCGDLRYALAIGYFLAPVAALSTAGYIAFKWVQRRFQISN